MAGLNPTKAEIDVQAGVIARALQKAINDVLQFKYFLDGKTDADLINLGFVQADVDVLRSAYSDLASLASVYQGVTPVAGAKDFRAFARRLWGMGDV